MQEFDGRDLRTRFQSPHSPKVGKIRADQLTRPMVAKIHLDMKQTPGMANYVLAVIASMYGFAQKRGHVSESFNPATRIEKYPERHRERFLTVEELTRLGDAIREAEAGGIPWETDGHADLPKNMPRAESRRPLFSPFAVGALRLLLSGLFNAL